jgi:GNAT superfamily N-acetyltransferase
MMKVTFGGGYMNDFTRHGPYLEMMRRAPGETAVTIRPIQPDDLQPILEMHRRLSTDSLFLRYLVPYTPTYLPKHLQHICHRPAAQGLGLVALAGAQVVGLGYYVIKPGQPDTAEPALLIEDRFQGQGIGGRMLDQLVTAARAQGVCFFDAFTHSSNRPMRHLLHRRGQLISSQLEGGHINSFLSLTTDVYRQHA